MEVAPFLILSSSRRTDDESVSHHATTVDAAKVIRLTILSGIWLLGGFRVSPPQEEQRPPANFHHSGAALAIKNWALQLSQRSQLAPVESFPNEDALITNVKQTFAEGQVKAGRIPRVIVIGALGRCGRGAVDMCLKAGIPEGNILKWDLAETAPGGPFKEVCFNPRQDNIHL